MKRLFWDIETSPNQVHSWRIGRELNIGHHNIIRERAIICICYKWAHESKVHSLQWDRGNDRKMLQEFTPVAQEADLLVAHNGDRFDLRWFAARNLYHGLPHLPEHKTVDTLKIARRKFAFNSNRLDYLGKFLGIGGKIKTDFDLWLDIVDKNCPKAMAKMIRYCKLDVRLLEKVHDRISPYVKAPSHAGVAAGREKWTCPHDGSSTVVLNQHRVTAAGTKQHIMKCKTCGRYYTINDKTYRDYLETK